MPNESKEVSDSSELTKWKKCAEAERLDKINAIKQLNSTFQQLSQWQECAKEMHSTIKLIRTEHNNTMYEVSDIGYSEGLCLKPSLKDSVDKALSLFTQLTQEQKERA